MRAFWIVIALTICGISSAASSSERQADVSGRASVIDGDTLEIHGTRIRLFGIDAPESDQICLDAAGQPYRCGQKAALFLNQLIAERPVVCQRRDTDRFRRIVAVCRSGPQDLGGAMVEAGWALAYTRYSRAYVGAQERAASGGRGLWQGHFDPPYPTSPAHVAIVGAAP